MRITRRQYNIYKELKKHTKENSLLLATKMAEDGLSLIIGGISDYEIILLRNPSEKEVKNKLLPLLLSDREILTQDYYSIPLLEKILEKYDIDEDAIPKAYLHGINKDIRYAMYPLLESSIPDFWNTETLLFNKPITSKTDLEKLFIGLTESIKETVIVYENKNLEISPIKVYISGPITNNAAYEDEFAEAEELLRSKGFHTINPVKLTKTLSNKGNLLEIWKEAMNIDLLSMVKNADEMALIPDKNIPSRGVAIEKKVASDFFISINPLERYRTRTETKDLSIPRSKR